MNFNLIKFSVLLITFTHFKWFHLYNYEIILTGKILYLNNFKGSQTFLVWSFLTCFSSDILFRTLIFEYQDQDVPKLINSIIWWFILSKLDTKILRLETDLFYRLSQAKLLTWGYKRCVLLHNCPETNLYKYIILASIYQNLFLGQIKNIITTIISLIIVDQLIKNFEQIKMGNTAFEYKDFAAQFIFYGFKFI